MPRSATSSCTAAFRPTSSMPTRSRPRPTSTTTDASFMNRRLALSTLAASLAAPVFAQQRPIRFIVPYAPGGPLDVIARALAEKTKDALGVVYVENKPGAGGNLGADL